MRKIILALSAASLFPVAALAQTADPEPAEEMDEIIVEGQRITGGDPAMDAFFRGDFETAEIEFERNFRIIQRGRTDIERAYDGAVSDQLNQIGAQTVTAGSQNEGGQIQEGLRVQVVPNAIRTPTADDGVVSGKDPGFQLYMAGLSELQQGKVDEAEASFKRALVLNETLYDGRMRLALIRLGKGDVEAARKQLKTLGRLSKRCKDKCDRKEELSDAEATLAELLRAYR